MIVTEENGVLRIVTSRDELTSVLDGWDVDGPEVEFEEAGGRRTIVFVEEVDADVEPPPPTVERVVRLIYPTPGFPRPEGECQLRVIRLSDGRRVAVVTEIPENLGASVTNAAEHIAGVLEHEQYDALIEHYPPMSHRPASLDEVLVTDGRASWRPVTGELRDTLLVVLDS